MDTLQGNTGNFTKRGNGNSWEMGWMSMDASRFAEMYYRWCQINAPGRFCSFSLPAVPFNHLQWRGVALKAHWVKLMWDCGTYVAHTEIMNAPEVTNHVLLRLYLMRENGSKGWIKGTVGVNPFPASAQTSVLAVFSKLSVCCPTSTLGSDGWWTLVKYYTHSYMYIFCLTLALLLWSVTQLYIILETGQLLETLTEGWLVCIERRGIFIT